MPYQTYDCNCERIALQRRLPEDDQWAPGETVASPPVSARCVRAFQCDLVCSLPTQCFLFSHAQVVPHNRCLMMFSPSTVNVLPFDPHRGADQALHEQNVDVSCLTHVQL